MRVPFLKPPDLRLPTPIKNFEIFDANGRSIGIAELIMGRVRKIHYAYLYHIAIEPSARGNGLGSQLLQEVNNFLRTSQRLGLLQNFLDDPTSPTSFYRRHGWLVVPEVAIGKWMYYPSIKVAPELFPQLIYDAQHRAQRIINKI